LQRERPCSEILPWLRAWDCTGIIIIYDYIETKQDGNEATDGIQLNALTIIANRKLKNRT